MPDTSAANLAATSRGLAVPDPALVRLIRNAWRNAPCPKCGNTKACRCLLGEDGLRDYRAVNVLSALAAEGWLLTPERRRQLLGDPLALAGWTPEQARRNEERNRRLPPPDDVVGRCTRCNAPLFECESYGCIEPTQCGEAYCVAHVDVPDTEGDGASEYIRG